MTGRPAMRGRPGRLQDHLAFVSDLLRLRRRHPALRGAATNPYYVHNDNRILAFHRWIDGVGRDVVVVAGLNESTLNGYELGFPQPGHWLEAFNGDFYDRAPNRWIAGNGGSVDADRGPRDGMPFSAAMTIPANGLLVFARDQGD